MTINWKAGWEWLKSHLRGALRSWTVWFGVALAAAPDVVPIVQQNFAAFAPYIPDALESKFMHAIALAIVLLRIKTTVSLATKGGGK